MKLCFGSNNEHKLKEIKAIFDKEFGKEIDLVYPPDILDYKLDPIESGATLDENALIKAQEFFDATRLITFADDTGLEIAALDGKPGVFSARYAGEDCS
jgi:XTP/dITP diphosphohydrolase